MTNHEITSKQMQAIFILFWIGSVIVSGINPDSKQDSWISIIFAGIMILPLIALYVRIIKLYPGLNLFEILLKIFGRVFGRILSFVLILYAIHLGSMVINSFSQFIHNLNMPETPMMMTETVIILLAMWSAKNGPENIGRISRLLWTIVAISVTMTFILAIKDMNLSYLNPIMEADFKSLFSSAFSYSMLPLGEIVVCFSLFPSVSAKASPPKIYTKSLVSFIAISLVFTLRNILVLGIPTALMYYYPSYQCVSIVSVGDFFTRIEVLIGVNLLLAGFIKITVCLYAVSLGVTKTFNVLDQKLVIVPCGLLMLTLTGLLDSNSVQTSAFLKIYSIYALPIECIFPFIIWIGAEIQNKIKTAGTQSETE